MDRQSDQTFDHGWVKQQYRTSRNLSARVQLHQRFSTNPEPWFAWVFDRLRIAPGARVLEVGGGHGLLWRENAPRLPAGAKIIVTDLSPGMVAQAAHSLSTHSLSTHTAMHFAQADAQQLPFAPGTCDIVVANHMLYHVPDRAHALAEIKRVLRPGGRFLAATNDTHHMRELIELAEQAQAKWPALGQLLPSHRTFPFATALEEVSRHFGQVELHHYTNNLVVTDASALADYMLSTQNQTISAAEETSFRAWIHEQMSATGQITIHSATGLIEVTDALA